MTFYTDYPIVELGDISGNLAPVRECEVVDYDGNSLYLDIKVKGVFRSIKRWYVYPIPGRLETVPCISNTQLREVLSFESTAWDRLDCTTNMDNNDNKSDN